MFTVNVSGASLEEFKANISKLYAVMHGNAAITTMAEVLPPVSEPVQEPIPPVVEVKKKLGRPKAAPVLTTTPEMRAQAEIAATYEMAKKALQDFNITHGIEKARVLIRGFKLMNPPPNETRTHCTKLSEIDPSQFEEFIAACQATQ